MKNIKTYNQFNEEINLKQLVVGGAITAAAATGIYHEIETHDKAGLCDTEILSGKKFKQYDVSTDSHFFDLNVSEEGVISAHWTTTSGSGKNQKTTHHNCITVPKGTTEIYYDTKFFESGTFVSTKYFKGSSLLELKNLTKTEETDTYIIYRGKFFSSVDHVVVNKGHTKGEEWTMNDDKINTYICDKLGNHIYLFGPKGLGGGKFGGAGEGSDY